MSHVSPDFNASLSQCLARSLVSDLWSPLCSPPMACHWIALVPREAVLQCAPCARTNGSQMLCLRLIAPQKTRRPQTRPAKASRLAQPFSTPPAAGHARAAGEMIFPVNRRRRGFERGEFPGNSIKQEVAAQPENRGRKPPETSLRLPLRAHCAFFGRPLAHPAAIWYTTHRQRQ